AVHSTLDLEKVFKQITDGFVYSMGYNTASILVINEDKNLFELKAFSSKKRLLSQINKILGFTLIDFSIPANFELNDASRAVLRDGKVKIVNTLSDILYPVISKKNCSTLQKITGTKNYITLPLKFEEEVVGGIFIASNREYISEEELSMITIYMRAAAHSIKNANLLMQTRQAEEALRESEERFRSLCENSTIGLYRTTPGGRILLANPTLLHLLGYESFEQLSQLNLAEEGFKSGYPRSVFKDRIESEGQVIGLETKWVKRDGSTIQVRESAKAIRDDKGNIIYYEGTIEDISERKRVEEEKQMLELQLRHQQKLESIGTLASGVAHEINNPLMGMINYAELIKSRIEDNSLKEFSEGIIEEGDRVAKIVKNLLLFARQEKESRRSAYIKDIIDASLSLIGAVLRKDRIRLNQDIPEDLPKIMCHSQQIQQVIINLLTNARDALNERYPCYDDDKIVKISVKPLEKDGIKCVRITIEDHGVGMQQDVIGRIFDPFFTTKPRDIGTGLGLSVSYGIIKEHNGEISVES
ncbi:MAG: PAS domain S-box protein, partial [Candidatus Marinimicrobia bacterium]|nr:PAS domain S-box protein [Candidatus Neomarinimicrobiota bacterium]